MVKLADICEINIGKTPSRSNSEYWGIGKPWLSIADMNQGLLISNTKEQISDKAIKETNIKLVSEGTVLYSFKLSIGKIGITQLPIYTNEAIAALPIKNKSVLWTEYLIHALSQIDATKTTDRAVMGATLNKEKLKELEIPLPPLEDQKRIAAILDKADAIRRKRQQAIKLADEFLRAVFLDFFGDPMTNPKGWESVKLGSICEVGSSKRVFVNEFTDSGIPFYRGTEIGQLAKKEDIEPHLFISPNHYENLKISSGIPAVGDLLLPSICHDGRIWKVDHTEPFYFKDGRVLWIKVNQNSINSDFLRIYLQSLFLAKYASIASGTTFIELKIVNLKSISILLPPLELQNRFSEIFNKIIKKNGVRKSSLKKSNQLFSCLSLNGFAGKL